MMRETDRPAVWDEPTFWYLLGVEAARARRGERPFLVLIADTGGPTAPDSRASRRVSSPVDLTTALARCLRETDLVGWHRTGRSAGALLAQGTADGAAARTVGRLVLRGLRDVLPSEVFRAIRIRIYRYEVTGGRAGFDRVFTASGLDGVSATPDPVGLSASMAGGGATHWSVEPVVSHGGRS